MPLYHYQCLSIKWEKLLFVIEAETKSGREGERKKEWKVIVESGQNAQYGEDDEFWPKRAILTKRRILHFYILDKRQKRDEKKNAHKKSGTLNRHGLEREIEKVWSLDCWFFFNPNKINIWLGGENRGKLDSNMRWFSIKTESFFKNMLNGYNRFLVCEVIRYSSTHQNHKHT